MILDVCTYNGEKDIWDIHYNVLKDHVDVFVVVEFDQTFSGLSRERLFPVEQYPDVAHAWVTEKTYSKHKELAESSPNTAGASHWVREFCMKEAIKDVLKSAPLRDDDTVILGDVDEIINPRLHPRYMLKGYWGPIKLKLDVYTYYLNNHSSEEFWGPIISRWGNIKDTCLNHTRTNAERALNSTGWHFTSMGGVEALKKKLTDSYTQESYATPSVLENIAYNIENCRDFLGREFTYTIDETAWPHYLKENREKYQHLMFPQDATQGTLEAGQRSKST